MGTIFMNSENSRTFEYHILVLKLDDKLDLRRGQKIYNNNKFEISAPMWSDKFELTDGSYSISDIQNYFEYILKKHSESVDNPSIHQICKYK